MERTMERRLASRELADCVWVSVPLHPLRLLERGYDQAALLANELQRTSAVPTLRLLARTRATAVQGGPGSLSRAANVRGAFRGRRSAERLLAGRGVWIVDDVMTSGSTASECARVLRRLGASRVGVVCLARAGAGDKPGSVPPARV
jgi:ComF family protein